jgi:hypothetical protein
MSFFPVYPLITLLKEGIGSRRGAAAAAAVEPERKD